MSVWAQVAMNGLQMGGNMLSTYIASQTAKRNTDKTNQANRELAEYQFMRNKEMWHEQNAYNAPAAQMQRLEAAGLNPHLVYGNGVVGNNAGAPPEYQAPRISYDYKPAFDPGSAIASYQNAAMVNSQIAAVNAQVMKTKTETLNEALRSGILSSQAEVERVRALYADELTKYAATGANLDNQAKAKALVTEDLTQQIMRYEIKLNRENMSKSDPLWARSIVKAMQELGITPTEVLQKLKAYDAPNKTINRVESWLKSQWDGHWANPQTYIKPIERVKQWWKGGK